jgi:hypothetical protein
MKNIMRPLKKCEVIILFFLLQLNSPVHTEELQTDCVGRMQISLFDHAELSATTLNDIKKKMESPLHLVLWTIKSPDGPELLISVE